MDGADHKKNPSDLIPDAVLAAGRMFSPIVALQLLCVLVYSTLAVAAGLQIDAR